MGFAPELDLVVQILADDAPPARIWTFPGLLGYHGINALGVASFANQLVGPAWRMGLPHYPLKRFMLGQSTLDVHTNHLLSAQFVLTERYLAEIPDSVTCLARIEAATEARQGGLAVLAEVAQIITGSDLHVRGSLLLTAHGQHEVAAPGCPLHAPLLGLLRRGIKGDACIIPEGPDEALPIAGNSPSIFYTTPGVDGVKVPGYVPLDDTRQHNYALSPYPQRGRVPSQPAIIAECGSRKAAHPGLDTVRERGGCGMGGG